MGAAGALDIQQQLAGFNAQAALLQATTASSNPLNALQAANLRNLASLNNTASATAGGFDLTQLGLLSNLKSADNRFSSSVSATEGISNDSNYDTQGSLPSAQSMDGNNQELISNLLQNCSSSMKKALLEQLEVDSSKLSSDVGKL